MNCKVTRPFIKCHSHTYSTYHVNSPIFKIQCHLQSVRVRGTYNLLLGLEDAHLAEPDVEGGGLEGAILLLHHHHVDRARQGRAVDLGVKLLQKKQHVSGYVQSTLYMVQSLTLTFLIMLFM